MAISALDPTRVVVKLKSKRTLGEFADHNRLSVRGLAEKADRAAKKKNKNVSVKAGIVGHLMSTGKSGRDTCNLATATAIEEALGCPPGLLFEPTVSTVADSSRRRSPGAAA